MSASPAPATHEPASPPTAEAPAALVGASIPRSGHHFLIRVLRRYYGRQMAYCEFYNRKDCCRQIPCTRRVGQRLTFQKNHDHDLSLRTDLVGVTYVIQHRHPVPEALSDRELLVKFWAERGKPTQRSRLHYMRWLARKIAYYKGFHDKWIASPPPGAVVLDYDALSEHPFETIGRVIETVDGPVAEQKLATVIEAARGARGKSGAYKPRVVEESPYFDRGLYAAFESIVLDLCPGFGYRRLLERVDYRRHPLWLWYRARQTVRSLVQRLRGSGPRR